jgi:hypothetical protein
MPELLQKLREKYKGQAFSEEEVIQAKEMMNNFLSAWPRVALPFVAINEDVTRKKFLKSKEILDNLVGGKYDKA